MKINGSQLLRATRKRVWFILSDGDCLARALPGCEEFTETSPCCFEVLLKLGVAGIKGTYRGRIRLDQQVEHESFRMTVDGKGVTGFIRGVGDIVLEDHDEGIQVNYTGDIQVGGTLAAVGQRLVRSGARIVIGQFFLALMQIVEDH